MVTSKKAFYSKLSTELLKLRLESLKREHPGEERDHKIEVITEILTRRGVEDDD
jgi:hypothetical protein